MSVSMVGVVGAGFMGTGIAESAAAAGLRVIGYEPEEAALDRARERLRDPDLAERIVYTTTLEDLAGADIAIEAIVEDPTMKGELFARLDRALPDAQLLASNTSSIPIAQLASWTRRPERVCGLHFFSPVQVMSLVEVVV